MSEGLCQIQITGRLGADPELRFGDKNAILRMRVAVTAGFGEREKTHWFGVVLFGRRGEGLAKVLHKGDGVAIAGRFDPREYQAKDGSTKTSLDIVADSVALLGGGKREPLTRDGPADQCGQDDSDIPF